MQKTKQLYEIISNVENLIGKTSSNEKSSLNYLSNCKTTISIQNWKKICIIIKTKNQDLLANILFEYLDPFEISQNRLEFYTFILNIILEDKSNFKIENLFPKSIKNEFICCLEDTYITCITRDLTSENLTIYAKLLVKFLLSNMNNISNHISNIMYLISNEKNIINSNLLLALIVHICKVDSTISKEILEHRPNIEEFIKLLNRVKENKSLPVKAYSEILAKLACILAYSANHNRETFNIIYQDQKLINIVLDCYKLCVLNNEQIKTIIANLLINLGHSDVITQSEEPIMGLRCLSPIIVELKKKSKYLSKKDLQKNLKCTVCQEEFTSNCETIKLPCGHIFHKNCIVDSLRFKNQCPNCRVSVEI